MQNNAKLLTTISIICLATGFAISYGMNNKTIEKQIEERNTQVLQECLSKARAKEIPTEILQSARNCNENILTTIHSPSYSGAVKNNETIVSSASGVTQSKDIRLQICKKVPNSPLCNEENYNMARSIAYKKALIWGIADREEFFRVGLGIMNSESTIGTNYAGTCDSSYNNFGGIKWRILDTGEAVKDQNIPQGKDNKCWLYKFNSLEDYFGSKYNSLGKGYGKCFKTNDPVYCISGYYVGTPYSPSWIANVKSISSIK